MCVYNQIIINMSFSFSGCVLGAVVGLCGCTAVSERLRLQCSEPAAAAGAGHCPEPLSRATSQRKGEQTQLNIQKMQSQIHPLCSLAVN